MTHSQLRTRLPALACLVLAAFLVACGGSSSGDSQPSGETQPSSSAAAKPPQSKLDPLAQALADNKTPLPRIDLPAGDRLGGTPDADAATDALNALKTAGFNVTGVEAYVLPVSGSESQLLVLDMQDTATLPSDMLPAFKALVATPSLVQAKVAQLVVNFHGADAKGKFVFTSILSWDSLVGMANGSLSEAEAQKHTFFKVEREGAP